MKRNFSGIILLLLAILGVFITRHYTESWDELQFYKYADHALESYSTWIQRGEIIVTGNTYDNYGPAFVILTSLAARAMYTLNPEWLISDYRHLVYFFTFLAGAWAFHDIAKRWMSPLAAYTAAALYLTQPLFWGHAFFSPKDIPFMSLFLLSLSFGFRMVDSSAPTPMDGTSSSARRTLALLSALWLVSIFSLFIFTDSFRSLIDTLVRDAASGGTNLISLIASDIHKVAPEIYIQKYFTYFLWLRSAFFLLLTFVILYFAGRSSFILHALSSSFILASLFLGITASTRILGPLAGVIVAYYAWKVQGKRSLQTLVPYAVLAIITMYITWPYLWPDPPARLMESLQVMSQYPWKGQVFFNGQFYSSTDLPLAYIPVLLVIQFTEPVWILFLLGLPALRRNNIALVSTLLWFVLPLLALIFSRAPLYDNTRQIFFILPPVFLAAGLGVDTVFGWLNQQKVKAGIAALLILPGLIAGVGLHPYEYVYYNHLIDDPSGRFELDYWASSYRESANWLNENAPANAQVIVGDPQHIAEIYLREDLKVVQADADYAILSTRYDAHEKTFTENETVYQVERGGMVFAVVRKLK